MYPITLRDQDVVLSIYRYRYLTTSQIQRLHFPSLRTAQRRLKALTDARLVRPFSVPGIADRIYMLTSQGAYLVSEVLGVLLEDLLWKDGTKPPKDYYFMKHFVAVSDFRLTLTKACERSSVSLLGFIPEHYGARHPSGRVIRYIKDVAFSVRHPAEKISHTPDAVFALAKDGKPALFFLEIDRGTEVISNPEKGVAKMIRFYEGYAREEKYKGYAEDFHCPHFSKFRLLIVTTSPTRLQNIREACGRNAPPLYQFFCLSTSDDITEETLLGPIWCHLDVSVERRYAMA